MTNPPQHENGSTGSQPSEVDLPALLAHWRAVGDVSPVDFEQKTVDAAVKELERLRDVFESTDEMANELDSVLQRLVMVVSGEAALDDVSEAVVDDLVGTANYLTGLYREGNESDQAEIFDALQNHMQALTEGESGLARAFGAYTAVMAGDHESDDIPVVTPQLFRYGLMKIVDMKASNLPEQRKNTVTDLCTISYTRTLMLTMHEAVYHDIHPDVSAIERTDDTTDLVVVDEAVNYKEATSELADMVKDVAGLCTNEDAKWLVGKLIERGWFDIVATLHAASKDAVNPDEKLRLSNIKELFLDNIDDGMRAPIDKALDAEDFMANVMNPAVIYGTELLRGDQPGAKRFAFSISEDAGANAIVSPDGEYHVEWIEVAPEFQGRGLGTKLYEQIKNHATYIGAKTVTAMLTSEQSAASARRAFGAEYVIDQSLDEESRLPDHPDFSGHSHYTPMLGYPVPSKSNLLETELL